MISSHIWDEIYHLNRNCVAAVPCKVPAAAVLCKLVLLHMCCTTIQ